MRAFDGKIDALNPTFHFTLGEPEAPFADRLGALPPLENLSTAAIAGEPGLVDNDTDTAVRGNNSRLYSPGTPELRLGTGGYSVMALMQWTHTGFSTALAIREGSQANGILMLITAGRFFPGDVSCETQDYITIETRCRTDKVFADGQPHVVVVTFSDLGGILRLYVDGDLYDERAQITDRNVDSNFELYLLNNSGAYQPWNGTLDEVVGFPYILNEQQIRYLTNAARASLFQNVITGNARTLLNDPVRRVVARDWISHHYAGKTTPDQEGNWSLRMAPGDYDVTYFADGCPPLCHGPYHVDQE